MIWGRNLFGDLLLLNVSSLSHAWEQCACLLLKTDYTRSVFWLQWATRHYLLICGLNTETGKSQGSYQGYLEPLASAVTFLGNIWFLKKSGHLSWDLIFEMIKKGIFTRYICLHTPFPKEVLEKTFQSLCVRREQASSQRLEGGTRKS